MAFITKLTANGLPDIRVEGNSGGGITLFVEAAGGDGRFLTIMPGGGHWEISELHDLPEGNGMDLDGNGYPVIQQT